MNTELLYLAYVTLFTAVLWIPYILNMILVRGVIDAVGYPAEPKPMAAWASRLKAAHYNAVENLVIFAVLILVANQVGVLGEATAMSAMVYFWARVVHAVSYAMAIPWVRTLAFVVGFGSQLCIAWQIVM